MKNKLSYLKNEIYKGAKHKKLCISDIVLDRLSYELNIIEEKGFTDYFITYSRIIEICNEQKLIRSYGRGSAPASLVNYCLDITNINPLEHNLRFEKFIHPLQKRLPDIDLDIPNGSRNLIIDKLKKKYSEYKFYKIAYLGDSIFSSDKVTHNDIDYKIHLNGTLIINDNLTNSIFNFLSKDYYICKDLQKDVLMDNKVDLVELHSLDNFHYILDKIGDNNHPYHIPLDNIDTFESLKKGKIELKLGYEFLNFMRLCEEFQPNSIQDLALLFAINRKPLLNSFPKLISFKNNKEAHYNWTDIRVSNILSETYGVIVYQETFIDIMIEIAEFDYIEAENWRTIFATKNDEVNNTSFTIAFYKKCKENSVLTELEISKLATLILDTARFTFQKSHSISHAIIGYWAAYYKTHFPEIFDRAVRDFRSSVLYKTDLLLEHPYCCHHKELEQFVKENRDIEYCSFEIDEVKGCGKCIQNKDICSLWIELTMDFK